MSNDSHDNLAFLGDEAGNDNRLWEYVRALNPQTVAQLSKPASREVLQLIQRAVVATLGNLPRQGFDTQITTNRDELGRLLGSAMVDGYFLRNVEQRLELEKSFLPLDDASETQLYLMGETEVTDEIQIESSEN